MREDFVKKWSLGIPLDRSDTGLTMDLVESHLTFSAGTEEIDTLRVPGSIRITAHDDIIHFEVSVPTDSYPSGEIKWDLHVVYKEESILTDEGSFVLEGEPTKPRIARPWDFLDPRTNYVSKDVSKKRLDICKSCDAYAKSICKHCGCFMPAKVTLDHATCPLRKW